MIIILCPCPELQIDNDGHVPRSALLFEQEFSPLWSLQMLIASYSKHFSSPFTVPNLISATKVFGWMPKSNRRDMAMKATKTVEVTYDIYFTENLTFKQQYFQIRNRLCHRWANQFLCCCSSRMVVRRTRFTTKIDTNKTQNYSSMVVFLTHAKKRFF